MLPSPTSPPAYMRFYRPSARPRSQSRPRPRIDPVAAPILTRVQLSDAAVADIVFRLSHLDMGDRPPKYINYRDLSVQQLGSVYERILEHGLKVENGRVVVAENPAARKSSGSYYTPEELVALRARRRSVRR